MKRKTVLIGYGVILLWMILPMISVFTASAIADASGCTLNEGSSHSCVVLGTDVGVRNPDADVLVLLNLELLVRDDPVAPVGRHRPAVPCRDVVLRNPTDSGAHFTRR